MAELPTPEDPRIIDLIVAVLDTGDHVRPQGHLVAELRRIVPAACGVLTELRWRPRTVRVDGWAPQRLGDRPRASLLATTVHGHPLARLHARTSDRSPLTLSDVTPAGAGDGGIAHQLVIPLAGPPGTLRCVALGRPGRHGFTSHDKEIATRVQPVLISLDAYLCRQHASPVNPGLTARETSVLTLLADGRTAHSIARRLEISPHTVNRHLEHIYHKLNTNDRLGTILRAEAIGLLPATRTKRPA